MPPASSPARRQAMRDLGEAIIRAELQIMLLCQVVAIRAAAGRDCVQLHGLIDSGEARLAALEAEQKRLTEGG